jgi:MoaA/NifB/PqqE/SkfB family radical SAM enzyme
MTTGPAQLDVLYVKLFDDCNARCEMCSCWQLPRTRRDTEYYVSMLDWLLALRPMSVRFTGGEPLLLPDLPALVNRAATSGARVSVITNGRLLRSKATRLAEAGCVEIVVSLDATGSEHDRIRATQGLFQHCLRGIDALADAGLNYGVNTVVQRSGIEHLRSLAELLLTRLSRPVWWHLIPVRDHPNLIPTPVQQSQLKRSLPAMRRLMAEHGVKLVADESMFEDDQLHPCNVPQFTAYAACDTGQLYGCNMLSHRDLSVGEFSAGQAKTAWSGPRATSLRQRCDEAVNDPCRSCDGGSRAMNHLLRAFATGRGSTGGTFDR